MSRPGSFVISREMQSTFPLSFLTIRRVRRSHRGSTAKNPSGRHRSQVELVTPSQAGVVGPFRPRVLAAANARPRYGCPAHTPRPRHFIETTARPFLPQPRHRNRPLRSRTLAESLRPTVSNASGVSSATWWQARRSKFASKTRRTLGALARLRGRSRLSTGSASAGARGQLVPTRRREPPTRRVSQLSSAFQPPSDAGGVGIAAGGGTIGAIGIGAVASRIGDFGRMVRPCT
jgi:hypothetical protein